MKSKTSAADATPTEQRAPNAPAVRFSLDYLIVIAGFGLCRAWIVFSLSASVSSFEARSEERRVGKECRSRWSPYH